MAQPAHSNAEEYYIQQRERYRAADWHRNSFPRGRRRTEVFSRCGLTAGIVREPSDRTISESGSLKEHIYRGLSITKTAMDWGKNEEDSEWFILRQPISSSN